MNQPQHQQHDLDRLIVLLFDLSRQMRHRLHHHPAPDGLSLAHLGTLHIVSTLKQPTMGAIAERLFITRPSATSLVNALVRSGHLRRRPASNDGRSIILALTTKGQRAQRQALQTMQRRLRSTLGVLSHRDINHLYAILTKLIPSS